MNKSDLYKRLMENIEKDLSNVLNEDFQFDDTEVAERLLNTVTHDKQLMNVVANANTKDWMDVIRGIIKIVKSKNIPENPQKIANIVQLAAALINRGLKDQKIQDKLVEMANEDFEYTANYLVAEIKKRNGGNTNPNAEQAKDGKQPLTDSKQANEAEDGKKENEDDKKKNEGCNGGDCNKDNKSVSESRKFRAKRGFTKFLNENNLSIRPGRNRR